MHGPTAQERKLMEDWIEAFVAFVNDDQEYDYGTRSIDDMVVATPACKIDVERDERWSDLVKLGEIFADDL